MPDLTRAKLSITKELMDIKFQEDVKVFTFIIEIKQMENLIQTMKLMQCGLDF